MARTSSGSARSEREVNSTRSTNRIETTLRSSGAGAARTNGEPQRWQNRAVSEFCSPQLGHRTTARVYVRGSSWNGLGVGSRKARTAHRCLEHEAVVEVFGSG